MIINTDLHIHSRFSGATSARMTLENLARGASQKGIDLIGSGDCLHPLWFREVTSLDKVDDGTFQVDSLRVILGVEVEDMFRVHHLILFPDVSAVLEFRSVIADRCLNMDSDGRPNIHMDGVEIAQVANDLDALIGPCHAFTPWTSLYAFHSSLRGAYGDAVRYVSLLELGLSADSDYADRIQELQDLTFLTNSDAHSPTPIRLAREFNRFKVEDVTFEEIRRAVLRIGGRRPVLNVGLPPQEGKYNESACIKCTRHYTLTDAIDRRWRCVCGGRIKKGVKDRVEELATWPDPHHPEHRPPYLHLIPLAEIIANALGISSPTAMRVNRLWQSLLRRFGDEVSVLIDAPIGEIATVAGGEIADAVDAFRSGRIVVHPGGGGRYGTIEIPKRRTLFEF